MNNKPKPIRDKGSFRDPSGYIFSSGNEIYRTVNPIASSNFKSVLESGVISEMVSKELMIPTELMELTGSELRLFEGPRGEIPDFVLRHPKVPFISYGYEWTFEQLKDAAVTHLELQIRCLECNMTLSDASSFNMQYVDGRFKHIDTLSLRPYKEGEPWVAYNQFCRMFLAPLLVEAWAGIPFQSLLRSRIDGLDLGEVSQILPKTKIWTSLNAMLHISLQAYMISKAHSAKKVAGSQSESILPRSRYKALLVEMKAWISSLKSGRKVRTYWDTYASVNTYSREMRNIKRNFIAEWAKTIPGGIIWDIGGNTGDYSMAAVEGGIARSIIFDSDLDSLEKAYAKSRKGAPILPLLIDIANPSPRQGWNQCERSGLSERSRPDGLIALAVIHHLAIGRNIPLQEIIDWIIEAAPTGIIEFVPKSDPMVVEMLCDREDVFLDYDENNFLSYLAEKAEIINTHRFSSNERLIVSYQQKTN